MKDELISRKEVLDIVDAQLNIYRSELIKSSILNKIKYQISKLKTVDPVDYEPELSPELQDIVNKLTIHLAKENNDANYKLYSVFKKASERLKYDPRILYAKYKEEEKCE